MGLELLLNGQRVLLQWLKGQTRILPGDIRVCCLVDLIRNIKADIKKLERVLIAIQYINFFCHL